MASIPLHRARHRITALIVIGSLALLYHSCCSSNHLLADALRSTSAASDVSVYLPAILSGTTMSGSEDDGAPKPQTPAEIHVHLADTNELTSLTVDSIKDEVWAGSYGGGVIRWDIRTGTYTRFTAPVDIPDNRVYAITIDDDGRTWAGTGDGATGWAEGEEGWRDVELAPGHPLRGQVRALVSHSQDTYFGIKGQGIRRLSPDGHWMSWLGAKLTVIKTFGEPLDEPLTELYGAPSLANQPVAGNLVWYGEACREFRAGGDVHDRVALIQLTDRDCTIARAVQVAERAGASAALLFGRTIDPANAAEEAGGAMIPVSSIDTMVAFDLARRLRAGESLDVRLHHDGLPLAARTVNSLSVDPDEALWVGTYQAGVFHLGSNQQWEQFQAEPPVEATWEGGGMSMPAYQFFNTPRLAGKVMIGRIAWVGTACRSDPVMQQPIGRIGIFRLGYGGCSTEEKLQRIAELGGIGALGYHADLPQNRLSRGGILEGRLGALPALGIGATDAVKLIELSLRGTAVTIRVPRRLTNDCVSGILRTTAGSHVLATGGCDLETAVDQGGLTTITPDGSDWTVNSNWSPMPQGGDATPSLYPGIDWDRIHDVALDVSGGLWTATDGGLRHKTDDGTWTVHSVRSSNGGLPDDHVLGIEVDDQGAVWAATSRGIARWSNQIRTWSTLRSDASLATNWFDLLLPDPNGALWLGSGRSTADVSEQAFASPAGLLHRSADGQMWNRYSQSSTENLLVSSEVRALHLDHSKRLWVGSELGLSRQEQDGTWTAISHLPLIRVQTDSAPLVFNGREPLIGPWAGNLSGELVYMGRGCGQVLEDVTGRIALMHYDDVACRGSAIEHARHASDAGAIAAVIIAPREGLNLVAMEDGFYPPSTTVAARIPVMFVSSIDGEKLLRTVRTSGSVSASLVSRRYYWDPSVSAMSEDPDGNMWFGGFNAIQRLAWNGIWTGFHWRNAPFGDEFIRQFYAIGIDPSGNRWIGGEAITSSYQSHPLVARLSADERSWDNFDEAISVGEGPRAAVKSIVFDTQENAWIATRGGGISLLAPDDKTWSRITTASTAGSIASDDIRAITFDAHGAAYLATAGGLAFRPAAAPVVASKGRQVPPAPLAVSAAQSWPASTLPESALSDLTRGWRTLPVGAAAATDLAFLPNGDLFVATAGNGLVQLSNTEPGDGCATAFPLMPGAVISSTLRSQADVDLFALQVPKAFSRVELTITDPDRQTDLFLRHSCLGIGSSGRFIGSSGRFIGSSGRFIGGESRLVFDVLAQPGTYYIDVRPRIGSQPKPIPYRLRSGLSDVDLASRRTLILTDESAMRSAFNLAPDDPEFSDWMRDLRSLQADSAVNGLLISDLRTQTNDTVRTAFLAYLDRQDNATASAFATALRAWIWERRAADLPKLQYIVIAADDRIIPQFRLDLPLPPAGSGALAESAYLTSSGIDPASPVGLALAANRVLSDDPYAAPPAASGGAAGSGGPSGSGGQSDPADATDSPLPRLAIGRLIERPAHMSAVLKAFLDNRGAFPLAAALVAASPAHALAAPPVKRAFQLTNLATDKVRSLTDDWRAASLASGLRSHPTLAVLALDGAHDLFAAPGGAAFNASQLLQPPVALSGTLVIASAAHAGLSVPGPDHDQPLDLPEALASRGAMFIAPTGYAYSLPGQLHLQDKLAAQLTRLLLQGSGRAFGDALRDAKLDYAADLAGSADVGGGSGDAIDRAALASITLYGLPMARIRAQEVQSEPADPDPQPLWGAEASPLADAVTERSSAAGLVAAGEGLWSLLASYTLPLDADPVTALRPFTGLQPALSPGRPPLPAIRLTLPEQQADGTSITPHGVLLLVADYVEDSVAPGVIPAALGLRPAAPGAGAPAAPPATDAWWPTGPLQLRQNPAPMDADLLVARRDARIFLSPAQVRVAAGKVRRFTRVESVEYYGVQADGGTQTDDRGPIIRDMKVATQPDGSSLLSATISDTDGVRRAVAAWTTGPGGDGRGRWASIDLTRDTVGDRWTGTLPAGASAYVQAVDGAGNVAVAVGEERLP